MKRKLTLFFSVLTLVLIISAVIIQPYYREYVEQTFRPIYPLVFLYGPCLYLSFGIALALLAFKEIPVMLFRRLLLFAGLVLVFLYLLIVICTLAGMSLGPLTWALIWVLEYNQVFFFPGIFIGMGLNFSPQD